jgi:NADH-quinone oxidoreductase subunit K
MSLSDSLLALSAGLLAFGILCVVLRRSLLAIFVGIELMLAAGNLALVVFNRRWAGLEAGDAALGGQIFVLAVVIVSLAQMALGLGLLIAFHRHRSSLDVADVNLLRW